MLFLTHPGSGHPTKQQMYSHLPPIIRAVKIILARHARHFWKSKSVLISDVLLWTNRRGWTSVGRPARTYHNELWLDTGYRLDDLPKAMTDCNVWRENEENRSRMMMMMMMMALMMSVDFSIHFYVIIFICLLTVKSFQVSNNLHHQVALQVRISLTLSLSLSIPILHRS